MEPFRILVVDDDPIYASFITETLRNAGHHVVTATTGTTAREHATLLPDAVILDLNLPDETGFDVARALRRDLPASAVIILLTAELHPARDVANAVGIDLVLTKPVVEELVTDIVAFVATRRARLLQR